VRIPPEVICRHHHSRVDDGETRRSDPEHKETLECVHVCMCTFDDKIAAVLQKLQSADRHLWPFHAFDTATANLTRQLSQPHPSRVRGRRLAICSQLYRVEKGRTKSGHGKRNSTAIFSCNLRLCCSGSITGAERKRKEGKGEKTNTPSLLPCFPRASTHVYASDKMLSGINTS